MQKVAGRLAIMVVAALLLWVPVGVLSRSTEPNLLAITLVGPIFVVFTYFPIAWAVSQSVQSSKLPLLAAAGIWVFAPAIGLATAVLYGENVSKPSGVLEWIFYIVTMSGLFPPLTFVAATYAGTLGALLLATVGLLLVYLRLRRRFHSAGGPRRP